jgi:hypothetical protein
MPLPATVFTTSAASSSSSTMPVVVSSDEPPVMLTSNAPITRRVGESPTNAGGMAGSVSALATTSTALKKFGKLASKSGMQVVSRISSSKNAASLSKRKSNASLGSMGSTFGVPLDMVPCASNGVPLVVEKALQHLEVADMKTEGIFRLSGAASTVQSLKEAFDKGPVASGRAALAECTDAHAIAGVVKLFLREMPEPLLSYALYESWIATQGNS